MPPPTSILAQTSTSSATHLDWRIITYGTNEQVFHLIYLLQVYNHLELLSKKYSNIFNPSSPLFQDETDIP